MVSSATVSAANSPVLSQSAVKERQLSKLHLAELVKLFSLEHARLDLTDSLREDLHLLRG